MRYRLRALVMLVSLLAVSAGSTASSHAIEAPGMYSGAQGSFENFNFTYLRLLRDDGRPSPYSGAILAHTGLASATITVPPTSGPGVAQLPAGRLAMFKCFLRCELIEGTLTEISVTAEDTTITGTLPGFGEVDLHILHGPRLEVAVCSVSIESAYIHGFAGSSITAPRALGAVYRGTVEGSIGGNGVLNVCTQSGFGGEADYDVRYYPAV